jgi:exportin-1
MGLASNNNVTVVISHEIFPYVMANHISHIPRPKEVLVTVDESGNVVQESYKDTESISLYETMKRTLTILSLTDNQNMTKIMLERLQLIVSL